MLIKHSSHTSIHLSLRMITSGHAFSILLIKICSISETPFIVSDGHQFLSMKKSIFTVKSKFNSHVLRQFIPFFPSILVSITQSCLPFWESAGKEWRKKGSDSSQFLSCFIHKEQHRSRKTHSFTRTYF